MSRCTPRSTLTAKPFPYTTLFRSRYEPGDEPRSRHLCRARAWHIARAVHDRGGRRGGSDHDDRVGESAWTSELSDLDRANLRRDGYSDRAARPADSGRDDPPPR